MRDASPWPWHSSSRARASRPTELTTEAVVSLDKDGDGFKVSKSALSLQAKVPGIDPGKFEELAHVAEKNCPISKVLNAEITLTFSLA